MEQGFSLCFTKNICKVAIFIRDGGEVEGIIRNIPETRVSDKWI
jgi:hypothetical protein